MPSFAPGLNFFQILKKIQVPGNLELSQKLLGCPQLIIIILLETKNQDWHYAEVLQLETGLQDTSLQPQQGARSLALPASISARKY